MRLLFIGGCKSGKSSTAQRIAKRLGENAPLYYWATMEPHDDEDLARIRRHIADRDGWGFTTVERSFDLSAGLDEIDPAGTVLFDSVTACLSEQMFPYGGEMDAQTLRSQLGVSTRSYLLQNGLFAVLLAPAINMFPALGEEVGWRGYMMPRLKERFGLLNGRLLGGVVWGVWHWPLMLLVGYEYGTNYLGAPVLGLVVWCVVCFALNTLLDLLYEKTSCIWVPAIAHGAFNAIAALPQVLITPADAYYNVLGPMPIGLISVLPMLAVAVGLTLHQMKQEQ